MDWTSTAGIALLSSIVGASSALVGVLLTSSFNVFIQWRQREHDVNQRAMDRVGVMRREVYLEAISLCITAIGQLARLTQKGNQAGRGKAFAGVSLAMAKIQVVCSPRTAVAAQTYNAEFARILQELMSAAKKSGELEIGIGIQNDLIADAAKEMRDAGEMVRQFWLTQRTDEKYFDTLVEAHKSAMSRHKQLVDELGAMHDEHGRALGIYQRELIPLLGNLNFLQRELLDCMRGEFGLQPQSADDIARRAALEASTRDQLTKFSDALAKDGFRALDRRESAAE